MYAKIDFLMIFNVDLYFFFKRTENFRHSQNTCVNDNITQRTGSEDTWVTNNQQVCWLTIRNPVGQKTKIVFFPPKIWLKGYTPIDDLGIKRGTILIPENSVSQCQKFCWSENKNTAGQKTKILLVRKQNSCRSLDILPAVLKKFLLVSRGS